MSRMPCKCSGFRIEKCKCKLLRSGNRSDDTGSVVLLAQSNSLCRFLDFRNANKPNIFMRLFENVYELCAGYNLRYCPMRGYVKHENYLGHTLKDLLILMCFLIANSVVFIAILTKMLVHMYFVLTVTVQWLRRMLRSFPILAFYLVASVFKTGFQWSSLSHVPMSEITEPRSYLSKLDVNEEVLTLCPRHISRDFKNIYKSPIPHRYP